jgi:hypothetical protein
MYFHYDWITCETIIIWRKDMFYLYTLPFYLEGLHVSLPLCLLYLHPYHFTWIVYNQYFHLTNSCLICKIVRIIAKLHVLLIHKYLILGISTWHYWPTSPPRKKVRSINKMLVILFTLTVLLGRSITYTWTVQLVLQLLNHYNYLKIIWCHDTTIGVNERVTNLLFYFEKKRF